MRRPGFALLFSLMVGFLGFLANSTASGQTWEETAAPTNVRQLGGVLSWEDNSSDETGFLIRVELFGSPTEPNMELEYQLAANVTSFVLPAEAKPTCDRSSVNWFVIALRGEEESKPGVASLSGDCAPAPSAEVPPPSTPPPSTEVALPSTGERGEANRETPITFLALCTALLAVGFGAVTLGGRLVHD
jgi:hypothetical protein